MVLATVTPALHERQFVTIKKLAGQMTGELAANVGELFFING